MTSVLPQLARPSVIESMPSYGAADAPALRGWDCPEVDCPTNARGEPLRILNIHNIHAGHGGFEVFYEGVNQILRSRGHHVVTFERDSGTIHGLAQKVKAFASAIHSPRNRNAVRELIEAERIDLVHLNNVLPLVSPSVISACHDAYGGLGVPVVMSQQDFKLTCPAGQHLRHGNLCVKCVNGHEYWCAVHACRESRIWSTAYTVRSIVNRRRGLFHDGITLHLPCSQFVADHLARSGFDSERMQVLPNFTDLPEDEGVRFSEKPTAAYAAYVGRISPEKGLDVLIEASRRTGIPVKIAGDSSKMPELVAGAPPQVQFVGRLSREALPDFYRNARFLVVPSTWYECFGIVAAEAQGYGCPVIASRIGGLPEVVQDGVTGLLAEPGDPQSLASAMGRLWNSPAEVVAMSRNAQRRSQLQFSPDIFYRRIGAAYMRAIELKRSHSNDSKPRAISLPTRTPERVDAVAYA